MSDLVALLGSAMLALGGDGSVTEPCTGWRSIPERSQLGFTATFEGAKAPGKFHGFDVCFAFDPGQPATGRLDVRIDMGSADMDSADLNEEIVDADWLDASAFPQAWFSSEHIETTGTTELVAHGSLTLKGRSQPVDVPFRWQVGSDHAIMSGELTLKRTAFGIGAGEWATAESIGDDVKVRFVVTLGSNP